MTAKQEQVRKRATTARRRKVGLERVAPEVSLDEMGLTFLAQFVAHAATERVTKAVAKKHRGVRASYGWVVQHLLGGPKTVSHIAVALGISQQAVSKSVRALETLGYVKEADGTDGRARPVALTARGQEMVLTSRRARVAVDDELRRTLGADTYEKTRVALRRALDHYGAADVKARRVRPHA